MSHPPDPASPASALVFGAAGGIGRALLARLTERRSFASVSGFSRRGDPPLDLEDEASIAAIARRLAGAGPPPRLVIVATGILHADGMMPEKALSQVAPDRMRRAFAVNAIGPALLMKHVLPLLPRHGRSVFATLSARVGSIGDNRAGGWHSYRASKAALNQIVRTAAIELRRTHPQAICVALHPGTVDTPLSAPFARTGLDVRPPATAADEILAVIDGLEPGDSGGFFDQHGEPVPW